MKILLVGNYAPDQQYSMQGFAQALLSGLCEKGIEVRLSAPVPMAGRLALRNPGISKWLAYVDKYVLFPPALKRAARWADVVHVCDQGNAIYVNHLEKALHVVTCHDLLAVRAALGEIPGWPTGRSGRAYQRLILNGLRRANHVVCDSEKTQRDFSRIAGVAEPVPVVYMGLFDDYSPDRDSEIAVALDGINIPRSAKFFLHVGANQPYKNRIGVLKIFKAYHEQRGVCEMKMVMAGKPFTPEMRDYVETRGLRSDVVELVGLDNEQLRALYSRAEAFLFPSLYEGFGVPIIEAQACGCPVFTSDRAPMTEVGGDAAVYFDPAQPEEAAQVIASGLRSRDAREAMVAAGFENVKRFTTERMIDEYIQVYRRVLSQGRN